MADRHFPEGRGLGHDGVVHVVFLFPVACRSRVRQERCPPLSCAHAALVLLSGLPATRSVRPCRSRPLPLCCRPADGTPSAVYAAPVHHRGRDHLRPLPQAVQIHPLVGSMEIAAPGTVACGRFTPVFCPEPHVGAGGGGQVLRRPAMAASTADQSCSMTVIAPSPGRSIAALYSTEELTAL